MKISKSLFKTEIELTVDELNDFKYKTPKEMIPGLVKFFKDSFNLNLITYPPQPTPSKK